MMNFDNSTIRRQDRLMDEARACELLRTGEYGFLAMVLQTGGGYGLPISFVWDEARAAIYLHCAPEGEKLRCLQADSHVTFCVVGRTQVIPRKFTTAYESVLVKGEASVVQADDERMYALGLILEKYAPDDKRVGQQYAEKSFHRTAIIRIDIKKVSAKAKYVSP